MRVTRCIRIAMVCSMVCCPPQRASLRGGSSQERQTELHFTAHGVGLVRKIPMVHSRDSKHTNTIRSYSYGSGHRAKTNPEDTNHSDVKEQKRYDSHPINRFTLRGPVPGRINPPKHSFQYALPTYHCNHPTDSSIQSKTTTFPTSPVLHGLSTSFPRCVNCGFASYWPR